MKPGYQTHTIPNFKKNEYIPHAVIDLETAQGFNAEYQPICSFAFCLSNEDGSYADPISYLVRPPNNEISSEVTGVHGITPDMTENAPEFPAVWTEIEVHLKDRVLVAHNADFDFSVIENELRYKFLRANQYFYTCTLDMARSGWKGSWISAKGFGLNNLAEMLNLSLNHHEAGSDAKCAADILKILMEENKVLNPLSLSKKLKVAIGVLGSPPRWKNGLRPYEKIQRFKLIDGRWAVIAPVGVLSYGRVVEIAQKDGDVASLKITGEIFKQRSSGGGILEYTHDFENILDSDADRYFWSG